MALNLEWIRTIPKKVIWLCVVLIFTPNLLDNFQEYYIDDMAWFLLLIPCFIFSYYLGFKGGLYAAVMGNIYHLLWFITEKYLLMEEILVQELSLHIGIAIVTFLSSILVGILSEKLKDKQLELQLLNKKLKEAALFDSLTGLPNRLYLKEKLSRTLGTEEYVSLMFIDLDGFKRVNDQYGHDEGDHLLKEVAKMLNHFSDDSTFISRLGGDEFIVLVKGKDQMKAIGQAEHILKILQLKIHDVSISASIGIALCQNGDNSTSLLKKADMAMYKAKTSGKNAVYLFESV